ncbi:putative transmembrane protein [Gregarina niphandrodes]|uniref:Transmembrane protein n=1 Tax=Gregarina niphandrodes TaxID=110365 RepID=A0A023B8M1_GRENI|nr:putative transmembrane protein [Gregarina niphandrodes]EZG69275.1 putative transmembrane protein [Gregarina niphandrodes]|eukprot:XP_011134453.1 putative transmembrane protein [Gregarina niphandrodes]
MVVYLTTGIPLYLKSWTKFLGPAHCYIATAACVVQDPTVGGSLLRAVDRIGGNILALFFANLIGIPVWIAGWRYLEQAPWLRWFFFANAIACAFFWGYLYFLMGEERHLLLLFSGITISLFMYALYEDNWMWATWMAFLCNLLGCVLGHVVFATVFPVTVAHVAEDELSAATHAIASLTHFLVDVIAGTGEGMVHLATETRLSKALERRIQETEDEKQDAEFQAAAARIAAKRVGSEHLLDAASARQLRASGARTSGARTSGAGVSGARVSGARNELKKHQEEGNPFGGRPSGGRPFGGRPSGGRPSGGRPLEEVKVGESPDLVSLDSRIGVEEGARRESLVGAGVSPRQYKGGFQTKDLVLTVQEFYNLLDEKMQTIWKMLSVQRTRYRGAAWEYLQLDPGGNQARHQKLVNSCFKVFYFVARLHETLTVNNEDTNSKDSIENQVQSWVTRSNTILSNYLSLSRVDLAASMGTNVTRHDVHHRTAPAAAGYPPEGATIAAYPSQLLSSVSIPYLGGFMTDYSVHKQNTQRPLTKFELDIWGKHCDIVEEYHLTVLGPYFNDVALALSRVLLIYGDLLSQRRYTLRQDEQEEIEELKEIMRQLKKQHFGARYRLIRMTENLSRTVVHSPSRKQFGNLTLEQTTSLIGHSTPAQVLGDPQEGGHSWGGEALRRGDRTKDGADNAGADNAGGCRKKNGLPSEFAPDAACPGAYDPNIFAQRYMESATGSTVEDFMCLPDAVRHYIWQRAAETSDRFDSTVFLIEHIYSAVIELGFRTRQWLESNHKPHKHGIKHYLSEPTRRGSSRRGSRS